MEILQVVTAIDSREQAEALARGVVELRLAAAAQVDGPIQSSYWWEDELVDAQEWRVTMKTTSHRYRELERVLAERHSYDTPAILATAAATGSEEYTAWIGEQTRRR